MSDMPTKPVLPQSGSGSYVIQIQGEVERHWERELRMQLSYCETEFGTLSTFSGQLPDQAALLGALQWLSMWGYVIVFVQYVQRESE